MRPLLVVLLIASAGMELAACQRAGSASPALQAPLARTPSATLLNSVPLGAPPGAIATVASEIRNPYEADPAAVQEGKRLYGAMNCAYCHGGEGSGLIGPALDGAGWRYGGTPAEIYNSVHDGRPKGMPAWGGVLPPQDIWKLVTFVESLGGAEAPATATTAELGPQASPPGPQPGGQAPGEAQKLVTDQPLDTGQRDAR